MICIICGGDIAPGTALRETGFESAWADHETAYDFCSEQCHTEYWASAWAFDYCEHCRRWIAEHDPAFDLRDPRARQFVDGASGYRICRRCAGIDPDEPLL